MLAAHYFAAQAATRNNRISVNFMNKDVAANSMKEQALALFRENRLVEAGKLLAEICTIDPSDAEAWFKLGIVNFELNTLPQAETCFRRVVELRPRLDSAYYNLARSLEFQAKHDEAIATYQELLWIAPNIRIYKNIGVILAEQGKFAEALEAYRQGRNIEPDSTMLIVAEVDVYEKLGDYDKAYARIRPLLEAGVDKPEIALRLASLSGHINSRKEAIDLLERLLLRGDWSGKDIQVAMHFAVGNLLDAAGNYERAFYHFREGNTLCGHHFDADAYAAAVDTIIRTFSADFMQRAPRAAVSAENLIFILGMPRSGTTLVEQILASHPQVFGCGELPDIGKMGNSFAELVGIEQNYPLGVVSLTNESCTMLAEHYLCRVKELSGNADFITDKMPQNFAFLGMISMLFPGAKVIHCGRDPLDTCLSCYFQHFRHSRTTLAFTTDLSSLGSYYRQYQRLMRHWKATLDITMMDVSYEKLVESQEVVTRQMLAFCGLPWDERCLKFHESERGITTASSNQVREPVYRRSVQRWMHYEQYLEPLKTALRA